MNNQLNQLVQEQEKYFVQQQEEQNLANKKAFAARFYRDSARLRNELEATHLIALLGLDLNTIHTQNQDASDYHWSMLINGSVSLEIDGQETVVDTQLCQEYHSDPAPSIDYGSDIGLFFTSDDTVFSAALKPSLRDVEDKTIAYYARQAIAKIKQVRQETQDIELKDHLRGQHEQALADYETLCQQWAEMETARLWQPWEAWTVHYCPLPYEAKYERYASYYIKSVVTCTDLCPMLKTPGAQIEIIDEDEGTLSDRVIAAFLDATPRIVEISSTTSPLAYHRHFRAGEFIVNVPPHVLSDPVAPPTPLTRPAGLDDDLPF